MKGRAAWCALLVLYWANLLRADEECTAGREQANTHELRLKKDLICGYNSDSRPVKDHKQTVTVKVRLTLKYISFDEQEEVFTIHSWVALTWKDEFLTWNKNDYGGIQEIQIESHEIWTPRLALFNADASQYPSDYFYTTCMVDMEGTVICVPHVAHSGMCSTQLRRWPYDKQICTFNFGSWMHTGEQVNFTLYPTSPTVLDVYQPGPGWTLLGVKSARLDGNYSCCPNNTYPMLKYSFELQRQAAGPAAIVVVPSIVIVAITITSLLLDIRDNTRLMLLCFSLFGHFMFLTEIGYDIPKHSSDTPIVLLFLRDSMLLTLAGVLFTLLLMSLRRRVLPPPTWLVSANRLVSTGPGRYVVFTEFDPSDTKVLAEDSAPEQASSSTSDWIQFANFLNSITFVIALLVYFILVCSYIPYGA